MCGWRMRLLYTELQVDQLLRPRCASYTKSGDRKEQNKVHLSVTRRA